MKNAWLIASAVFVVAALPASGENSSDVNCVSAPYEYCQAGCPELGEWVVQVPPVKGSVDGAMAMIDSLSQVEQLSAAPIQVPAIYDGGWLVMRRELKANQVLRSDGSAPHWEWQGYTDVLRAAADASVKGGWIFPTNEGTYVRVWFANCAIATPTGAARKRAAKP